MKLNRLCDEWLENYQKPRVKRQTLLRYRGAIDNYVRGALGDKAIRRIDSRDVQKFIGDLAERRNPRTGERFSPSTVNLCLVVLKMVFGYAVDFGLLRRNPAANVRGVAEEKRRQVKCFTVEEQAAIERYAAERGGAWCGILLDLYTGLRIGELLALTWEDVDFATGTLRVRRTVYNMPDDEGKWRNFVSTPKTASSVRDIPLADHTLAMLAAERRRSVGENVIAHPDGAPMDPRLYRMRYDRMLAALGIRHLNFHALRHTFATRALESGMDVRTLSEVLGHADAVMTLTVYAHSMEEHKRRMMNLVNRGLGEIAQTGKRE